VTEESLVACFACAMFSFRLLRTVLASVRVKSLKTGRFCPRMDLSGRKVRRTSEFIEIRVRSFGTRDSSSYT
jgi:hypothetical protein